MRNRPGQITKTVNIDLPPRTPDVLTSTEYLQYKDESLEVLHREAVKVFAEGSKAGADFLEAYAGQRAEARDPMRSRDPTILCNKSVSTSEQRDVWIYETNRIRWYRRSSRLRFCDLTQRAI